MSAPKYLLDTNILSDVIKNPKGNVAKKIRQIGSNNIFTSIIVASELQFGLQKKTSPELKHRVTGLLDSIQILDLKSPSDQYYGKVRSHLQKVGTPIGPNDLFIAAHALAQNLVLITNNVNEFRRVPDLKLENWLE
jgi:tRNA(fMet)-specific endonuclease VapC